MTVETQRYTADEFWELASRLPEGRRFELVRGEIVEMAPTGGEHGTVAVNLIIPLGGYVRMHDLGRLVGTETGFVLFSDPDIVRAPDVAFIAKDRGVDPATPKFIRGAPDLAVELISPSETARDILIKVLEHFRAGTRLVWTVYPDPRTVNVHLPDGTTRTLGPDDVIDGGDVVPGFRLPVRELFEGLRD